jgi:hypothetical protein
VVEHVFGVLKKRWAILMWPPQFNMNIQVKIPPALAALHNFILDHNPHDIDEYLSGDADASMKMTLIQTLANLKTMNLGT